MLKKLRKNGEAHIRQQVLGALSQMSSGSGISNLRQPLEMPQPYGDDYSKADDAMNSSKLDWERYEKNRILWGNLARNRISIYLRTALGLLIFSNVFLTYVLAEDFTTYTLFIIAFWTPVVLLCLGPAWACGEYSRLASDSKKGLRKDGGFGLQYDLDSSPGMDLVTDDHMNMLKTNAIQTILVLSSIALLCASTVVDVGSKPWLITLLFSAILGVIQSIHASLTSKLIQQMGDKFPVLSSYAPTHHSTQFDTMFGAIIEAHLDPDLKIDWDEWIENLSEVIKPEFSLNHVRERLLYILFLNANETISDDVAMKEVKSILTKEGIDSLLMNDEAPLNWRTIQRLILHARAWQPSSSKLIGRLQDDLIRGKLPAYGGLRVDGSLDEYSEFGIGHLFIALTNHTNKRQDLILEIVTPSGEPKTREHRISLKPCGKISEPLELFSNTEIDVVEKLPHFMENSAIMWLRLSWPKDVFGENLVILNVSNMDEEIISSLVWTTRIRRFSFNPFKKRLRRILKARKFGDLPLPKV